MERTNRFNILGEVQVETNKSIVISESVDGKIYIAQKLSFFDGETEKFIFLKNAINISKDKLPLLYKELGEIINKIK